MDLLDRAPGPSQASPVNQYELERKERIEANRKRMGEGRAHRSAPHRRRRRCRRS
jgi:hypothetical protein